MARNEEKHYGRLNRLYLQQEKEEYLKKHPRRPKLDTLNTVEEIQEWLPSIKQDLDFYLKQCQVPCYPEHKIAEFQNRVLRLEKEYKSFVRKTRQLSPGLMVTPWTNRPYQSKKKESSDDNPVKSKDQTFTRIQTPLIDSLADKSDDHDKAMDLTTVNVNTEMLNKPLQFADDMTIPKISKIQVSEPLETGTTDFISVSTKNIIDKPLMSHQQDVKTSPTDLPKLSQEDILASKSPQSLLAMDLSISNSNQNYFDLPHKNELNTIKNVNSTQQQNSLQISSVGTKSTPKHILGIDYSSSDSDQEN